MGLGSRRAKPGSARHSRPVGRRKITKGRHTAGPSVVPGGTGLVGTGAGRYWGSRCHGSEVTIREATKDDLEPLRGLYAEFHSFHVQGVPEYLRLPLPGETDPEEFDRAIERLIDSDEATLLIAEADGRLVGFAEVYLDPANESPFVVPRRSAKLQSLLVTKASRGTGLGGALIDGVERWALARGAEEIRARTWEFPGDPLAFYASRGYTTLSRELVRPLLPHK